MTDGIDPPGGGDSDGRKPRKHTRSPYENAPYEVGKGKPPAQHRFKKGGKAGPGRPRGSRNRPDLDKLLDEPIQIGEDRLGRPIRRSGRRVINMQLMKQAAQGDLRAIKIIKEFELRLEAIKVRQGEAAPTVEEVMRQAKEDQLKQELSAKLAAGLLEHMEMITVLKRMRLLGRDGKTWSTTARHVFDMIERGELSIDKANDEDG